MSKDKVNDETREAILAKMATKASAGAKLASKNASLEEMIMTYGQAIGNHEQKIDTLRSKITTYKTSMESNTADIRKRELELERMGVILKRYDDAYAEAEVLSALLVERINANEWQPGMAPELRDALDSDQEYLDGAKRMKVLNEVKTTALTDINRIFFNRGDSDV